MNPSQPSTPQQRPAFPRWLIALLLACCAFMVLAGVAMLRAQADALATTEKLMKDLGEK